MVKLEEIEQTLNWGLFLFLCLVKNNEKCFPIPLPLAYMTTNLENV